VPGMGLEAANAAVDEAMFLPRRRFLCSWRLAMVQL